MREVFYIGSADQHVYAFDCQSGELIWRFGAEGGFGSTPAIHKGVMYIGSWDGNVYAIDATTGKEIWRFKTGDDIESSPCIANDTVYIGSTDKTIYAIDLNGERKWRVTTGYKIESTPLAVNDLIIIGSEDGNIYAIDDQGREAWKVDTGDEVRASAVEHEGFVYIGSSNGLLYKLKGETGDIEWTVKLHAPTDSTPTMNDGNSYIGTIKRNHEDYGEGDINKKRRVSISPGCVQAFNTETAKPLWKFLTGDSVWAKPAVNNGLVYTSCHDSYIYAIDQTYGVCGWKYRTDSYSNSSPAIGSDGTVYVGSGDCRVYALDGITGEQKWSYLGLSRFGSSPQISFLEEIGR